MEHKKQGFTLVELLVVVLIIGILAAVALPQYQKAVDKSRFATVKNTLQAIKTSQQMYFMANGSYATDLEELDLPPSGCNYAFSTQCHYPWGYCYLACVPSGSCGGCLLHLGKDSWVIFMSNQKWESVSCLANIGSTRAYQLCQNDTGKQTHDYSDGQYHIFSY